MPGAEGLDLVEVACRCSPALETRPTERPTVADLPAYSALLVVALLHLGLGSYVQLLDLPFGIAFSELLIFAAIPWLLAAAQNFRPAPFLGLRPPPGNAWGWVLLAAVACFFVAGGLNGISQLFFSKEMIDRVDPSRLFAERSGFSLVALVIGVAVLAPIGEELFFRGYLLRVLGARHGWIAGVGVTSFLFALLHLNPVTFVPLLVLGAVFGLLRVWTGSLLPAIVAHMVQNGVTTGVLLLTPADLEAEEATLGAAAFMLLFSAPILFGALRILRRRAPRSDDAPPEDPTQPHELSLQRVGKQLLALVVVGFLSIAIAIAATRG